MIPDFVPQTQEILRQLQAQTEVTYQYWQDSVASRFRDNYLAKYDKYLGRYINGSPDQLGMGLAELLQFIDEKAMEMTALSGIAVDEYASGDPVVNDRLERVNWSDDNNRPGELAYSEFRGVMDNREQNN